MEMTLTREQVQAYLEVASKATPEPWKWQERPKGVDLVCRSEDESIRSVVILPCEYAYEDDADFIAQSRTIAPQLAEALLQAWDVMEHAVKTCPVCDGSTRPHYAHHANCYCEPMRELLGLKCICIKGKWKSSDCPVHGVECQALEVRE